MTNDEIEERKSILLLVSKALIEEETNLQLMKCAVWKEYEELLDRSQHVSA